MPNNPRQATKQAIQSAINELQKAADKFTIVAQPFESVHPDYYDAFCGLVAACIQTKTAAEVLQANI